MNRENDLPGCYTLAWEQAGLYRGDMEWEEKGASEGRVLFTCPEEGLDYLLYAADRDGDIHLEDYGYLCLEPEVLEEHSMCFQLSFYENQSAVRQKQTEKCKDLEKDEQELLAGGSLTAALIERLIERITVYPNKQVDVKFTFRTEFEAFKEAAAE